MPESRVEIARKALTEITTEASIGAFIAETDAAEGVTNLTFESVMLGYPGWRWTVSVAQVDGSEPTVLETELMPAEGALLAPDWVPWADRMDDYLAAQAAVAAALAEAESDDDDEFDDDIDDDIDDDMDDDDDEFDDDLVLAEPGVDESDEAEGDADSAGDEPPHATVVSGYDGDHDDDHDDESN